MKPIKGNALLGMFLVVFLILSASTAGATMYTQDQKLEVEGILSHQSIWRNEDFSNGSDYIQGRNNVDLRLLYHALEGAGPIDKLDFRAITRGTYDIVYDNSDDWGASGGFFSKEVEENLQKDFDVREAYAHIETGPLALRLGKQQIVWGKSDFFRLLDIVNPLDYSWHFFFESFDDIRIPLNMVNAIYSVGNVGFLDDVSIQGIWNPTDFESTALGRFGQPWALAPPGFELIPAFEPDGAEYGGRLQARIREFSFTLNDYYTYQDDPVFDLQRSGLVFPRVNVAGGAVDYYNSFLKSVLRAEVTYTSDKSMGVDFADANAGALLAQNPNGIVEKDEIKYVLGVDRDTWLRFLNSHKTFFLSAQLFMTHVLDHEDGITNDGAPTKPSEAVITVLANTQYMYGRLKPQVYWAYDVEGNAHAMGPSLEYLISNYWDVKVGSNIIWGKSGPYANFGGFRDFDEYYFRVNFSF